MSLYLGELSQYDNITDEYLKHVAFHNKFFNVIKCDLYESENENNITFRLNTYGKKLKQVQ